jgi:predicted flap endonuclease-1-like 5' DNA nuclease
MFIEELMRERRESMTRLNEIEGVGEVYSHKLHDAGIDSTEELLESCATPKTRRMIAERAGISEAMLLKWLNNADLFRIKGIGQEYADLLEVSGVDTVPELAMRNPENLLVRMMEVNTNKKLVRKMPNLDQVRDWITQAKSLPRMISY